MKSMMENIIKSLKSEIDNIFKLTERKAIIEELIKAEEQLLVLEAVNIREVLNKIPRLANANAIHHKKKEILKIKRKLVELRGK